MELFKLKCKLALAYIKRTYCYCMLYMWKAIGFISKKMMGVFNCE